MDIVEPGKGHVWLVGAGPGDPELLTLRAARLIEQAGIIVHDRLVSREILAMAKSGAELINVGKRPGRHLVPQEEITTLLAQLALAGRNVVRLKGGDPFVFGRGGEEAEALRAKGIAVEIVPGITAAQGAAASLGLPLTMRCASSSLRYVTGHMREGADIDELDWLGLTDKATTLVVYMGASNIGRFAARLIKQGRHGSTPAMAIASATCENQDFVISPLSDLARNTKQADMQGPILFIIGKVVGLARHLHEEKREANGKLAYEALSFLAAE
jgi:uroporphyrin-III C-methyltransferase